MFRRIFGQRATPASERARQSAAADPRPERNDAVSAGEVLREAMLAHYKTDRGVQVETVISALGAVCGQMAQSIACIMFARKEKLAEAFPDPPNLVTAKNGAYFIFHELANQLLVGGGAERRGPFQVIDSMARAAGMEIGPELLPIFAHTAKSVGGEPFPALTIPKDKWPAEPMAQAIHVWWPAVTSLPGLKNSHSVHQLLGTAVAAGNLIQMAKGVASADVCVQLFMETAVASSKVTGLSEAQGLDWAAALKTVVRRAPSFWA